MNTKIESRTRTMISAALLGVVLSFASAPARAQSQNERTFPDAPEQIKRMPDRPVSGSWRQVPLEIPIYEIRETGGVLGVLFGPRRPYALSPDGEAYVAFADDGILSVWDPRTGKRVRQLPFRIPDWDTKTYAMTRALGVGPRDALGTRLIGIDRAEDEGVYALLIVAATPQATKKLDTSSNKTLKADIAFGSRSLAYAGSDYLEILDLHSSEVVRISDLPAGLHGSFVTQKPWPVVFGSEDTFVAFGQANTSIAIFNLAPLKRRLTFRFSADLHARTYPITMLDVSPSGKLLAGGPAGWLEVFSVESGKSVRILKDVRLARFLTEDILLAVASSQEEKGTVVVAIDLKTPSDTGTTLITLEDERIDRIGLDSKDNLIVVPFESRTYFYVLPGVTSLAKEKLHPEEGVSVRERSEGDKRTVEYSSSASTPASASTEEIPVKLPAFQSKLDERQWVINVIEVTHGKFEDLERRTDKQNFPEATNTIERTLHMIARHRAVNTKGGVLTFPHQPGALHEPLPNINSPDFYLTWARGLHGYGITDISDDALLGLGTEAFTTNLPPGCFLLSGASADGFLRDPAGRLVVPGLRFYKDRLSQKLKTLPADWLERRMDAAVSLHVAGRLGEADKAYSEILATFPNHVPSHANLGDVYFKMGRLIDAEKVLTRAIKIAPASAAAHCNLGLVYNQLAPPFSGNSSNRATTELEKAVELDPGLRRAYELLGVNYFMMRQYRKAKQTLDEAVSLGSNSSGVWHFLGWANEELGLNEEALRAKKKAAELEEIEKRK